MLMYTVLDILMKFGFKCQNHIMILKLCISYGNSGNWYSRFGPLKSILSISVNFDLVLSIWSTLIHSVQFNDALRGEVCVEREVTLVTIMSYSQCNVGRFWIKLHIYLFILVLYFFFNNICNEFTYICVLFKSFKTYRGWTVCKNY